MKPKGAPLPAPSGSTVWLADNRVDNYERR